MEAWQAPWLKRWVMGERYRREMGGVMAEEAAEGEGDHPVTA